MKMKKFIGIGNETPDEIKELLSHNADEVEEGQYFRKASAEEIQGAEHLHTKLSVEIGDLEEKKKLIVTEYDGQIKPKKEKQKEHLKLIRQKGEHIKGNLYKFIDREIGRVGFYDPQGFLVSERPIMEDERGTNIIGSIRKASGFDVTDDLEDSPL